MLYASGSTSVDVYAAPAAATQTLDALWAAAQGWPLDLSSAVLPAVEHAAARVTSVLGHLGELEAATAFNAVHPVSNRVDAVHIPAALSPWQRHTACKLS